MLSSLQASAVRTPIPVKKEVKYLEIHLHTKLTWKTHIKAKRRQLELKLKNIELANNRTFTAITRQQTDRIQGNTATCLVIRDRAMGMQQDIQHQDPPNIPVKNAQNDQQCPWYVSNQTLHSDFYIPHVTEVVRINVNKYKNRSTEHRNQLIRAIFNPSADRRLKRLWP